MKSVLVLAAIVPAVLLMLKVYQADRLEREPVPLLLNLVFWGVVATELAALSEQVGILLLELLLRPRDTVAWKISWAPLGAVSSRNDVLYDVLLYFGVVAISEEGIKYLLLRFRTWNHQEFNCTFDGVVYAVTLSLGFALWENIHYVLTYGLSTAAARAVTAVPGHACFGVFMGTWYGFAKKASLQGQDGRSRLFRALAVAIPMLLHGVYDYIAAARIQDLGWVFLPFIGCMFVASWLLVKMMAKRDGYIQ